MKMWVEQRRQAMLQLHLSDQQILLPTKVHIILEILHYAHVIHALLCSVVIRYWSI